jgi:hypothetical protein
MIKLEEKHAHKRGTGPNFGPLGSLSISGCAKSNVKNTGVKSNLSRLLCGNSILCGTEKLRNEAFRIRTL